MVSRQERGQAFVGTDPKPLKALKADTLHESPNLTFRMDLPHLQMKSLGIREVRELAYVTQLARDTTRIKRKIF